MKKSTSMVLLGFLAFACSFPTARADEKAVRAAIAGYVSAFNSQDLAAVSAAWATDAIHTDRETGERTRGREQIASDIQAAFTAAPSLRLAGSVDSVQMVRPDVANVDGQTVISAADELASASAFTATLVKEGDKWMIATMDEMAVAQPRTPKDALKELEWLVGTWVDDSEEATVTSTIRFTPNEAFLLRSYVVTAAEGQGAEGTQIIAWDPRGQQFRSWSFNSDGSFGSGVWSRSDEDWLIKSNQTLSDGSAASGTYVLSPIDANSLSIGLIGHEVDGLPQPKTEASVMVRSESTSSAAAQ